MAMFVHMLEISANAHNINSIIAMYGDAKVTPALHGCHGNSIIYHQWQQFDNHSENFAMNMRKFEGYPCMHNNTPGELHLKRDHKTIFV